MSRACSFRSPAAWLLPFCLLAACATLRPGAEAGRNEGNVVIVDEPRVGAGQATPEQPVDPNPPSPVAQAAARLVANDGRFDHRELSGPAFWFGGGCAPLGLLSNAGPLADEGVYGSVGGARRISSWMFVGVALGGDGASPGVFAGRCDHRWLGGTGAGGRMALLAPELTRRDTSLLFTTTRAGMTKGGGAASWILGTVMEQVTPARGDGNGNGPRTAKPRPSEAPSAQGAQASGTSAALGSGGAGDDASSGSPARASSGRAKARP